MNPLFKKNVDNNRSYKIKNTVGKSFDGLWHFHNEYELIYICEGKGEKIVGDNISTLSKGNLLFLGSELPHQFSCNPNFPRKNKSGSLVVHLNNEFFTKDFLTLAEFSSITELIKQAQAGIQFKGDTKSIAERIQQLFNMGKTEGILEILSILNDLSTKLNYKLLASPSHTNSFDKKDYQRINNVFKYVMENYQDEITLNDVVDMVGLTRAAFCRHFKKITGKTFFTYVKEYRIGKACELLTGTNKNVSEISYNCGYNTISNFNKQFKTVMEMNPSTYRKHFMNKQD